MSDAPELHCAVCNVQCTDPAALKAHMSGKRHLKAAARAEAAGAGAGADDSAAAGAEAVLEADVPAASVHRDEGAGEGLRPEKQSRAMKKRHSKAAKAREVAARKEQEQMVAQAAAVNSRQVELEAIQKRVAHLGLSVHEIEADGHCLFRAVAHQLRSNGDPDASADPTYFARLRRIAGQYMLDNRDGFQPFMPVDTDGEFATYCQRLMHSADWGGELEVRALSEALRMPIHVMSANAPPVCMGDEFGGRPLLVSFHQHYYSLGAHYNSLVLK